MNKSIRNEIVESMVNGILIVLVTEHTEHDAIDIGLEADVLVPVLKAEANIEDWAEAIDEAWDEAYDDVTCGNGEYWRQEYGLDRSDVEEVIDDNSQKIVDKVLSLLK